MILAILVSLALNPDDCSSKRLEERLTFLAQVWPRRPVYVEDGAGDGAFAQMHFSGRHVGVFRGFPPTGKPVHWSGAALFQFEGPTIARLWVLADVHGLEAMRNANHAA